MPEWAILVVAYPRGTDWLVGLFVLFAIGGESDYWNLDQTKKEQACHVIEKKRIIWNT